ncbi:uncharacterized protein ACN427_004729 [Glossina fuscipes fuscipes]
MALMKYFFQVREQQPNLDEDIRDILAKHRRPATAIPVHNIRVAYKSRKGAELPIKSHLAFSEFMLTIPYVAAFSAKNGTFFYYRVD